MMSHGKYIFIAGKHRNLSMVLNNNDELKAILKADDIQSTAELAAAFKISIKTILVHFRQIGNINKLDKWSPARRTR